jgi:hypothetical protein
VDNSNRCEYIDINSLNPISDITQEWVSWVDIMGIKNIFKKSDRSPTVYILKLHNEINRVKKLKFNDIGYYPVMDGSFLTSNSLSRLINFMTEIFIRVANEFMIEKKLLYRFMIRGGLSYGSVLHGYSISDKIVAHLDQSDLNKLIFGEALCCACESENNTPPFMIKIHKNSINKFIKTNQDYLIIPNSNDIYVKWFNSNFDISKLRDEIKSYFDWHNLNNHLVEYPDKKKQEHLKMFREIVTSHLE